MLSKALLLILSAPHRRRLLASTVALRVCLESRPTSPMRLLIFSALAGRWREKDLLAFKGES
jgi:hypothetical protein